MHRERVKMLRDMLEGIPEERVRLSDYYTENGEPCNTIACIAGWAAIYPPFVEQGLRKNGRCPAYTNNWMSGADAAALFFQVPARTFFSKQSYEYGTDKEVALARLDKLLEAK